MSLCVHPHCDEIPSTHGAVRLGWEYRDSGIYCPYHPAPGVVQLLSRDALRLSVLLRVAGGVLTYTNYNGVVTAAIRLTEVTLASLKDDPRDTVPASESVALSLSMRSGVVFVFSALTTGQSNWICKQIEAAARPA